MKSGDRIAFIYGWPGPDIDTGTVLEVRDHSLVVRSDMLDKNIDIPRDRERSLLNLKPGQIPPGYTWWRL